MSEPKRKMTKKKTAPEVKVNTPLLPGTVITLEELDLLKLQNADMKFDIERRKLEEKMVALRQERHDTITQIVGKYTHGESMSLDIDHGIITIEADEPDAHLTSGTVVDDPDDGGHF